MTLGAAFGTALKEGGPSAGILILLAFLGFFDLALPGTLPPEADIVKPVAAMTGALAAYTFLPRRRGPRVLMVLLLLLLAAALFAGYHYFNNVPASPDSVTMHFLGAIIALVLTYFFIGALLRELISSLLVVFRMQVARGGGQQKPPEDPKKKSRSS